MKIEWQREQASLIPLEPPSRALALSPSSLPPERTTRAAAGPPPLPPPPRRGAPSRPKPPPPRRRYRSPAAPPSLEQPLPPSNAAARSYAGDQSIGRKGHIMTSNSCNFPILTNQRSPKGGHTVKFCLGKVKGFPGCLQKFGRGTDVEIFGLKIANYRMHKAFNFQCFASGGRGFGTDFTNKKRIKSKKRAKDVVQDPSEVASADSKNQEQWAPELGIGRENKSGNVMDKKFLEKVEAVRRSALDKKKVEENKTYQTIDYDAPIESDESTIGFGTRVGIGIAVVVFGLVFTLGDFLPSGSVSPSNESTVVNKQLSEEERTNFKRALEGYEETLTKSPNDPTALEGAAVSLVELGEYEKASDLLEKLVKVIPDKAEAYRLLGEVKFELKDYEGSSSSYRNSLSSSDSVDFEVLRGLTNSLVAAKKPDQAVEVILSCRRKLNKKSQTRQSDLEAANENGPQKSRDIDPIQVDLLLGKAYSDWGHISDAVTVYDNLITEHPEDFRGYLAKGALLKQNGKAGDAERMFIQAKFFAPEAAKALVDIYAQR